MSNSIGNDVLLNQVSKLVKAKKFSQAKYLINKNNKAKGVGSELIIPFSLLEIECLLHLNQIDKAEIIAKNSLIYDSIEYQLKINNMLGQYFSTNDENADFKKAVFYLYNSYQLDSSINNSRSVFLLYQLSYSRYDFIFTEQLWQKLKTWQTYFEPSLILRLQFSFRAGLKQVVNNSLNLLLKHEKTLSKENFSILLDYLLMSNRYIEATNLLESSSQQFKSSNTYITYKAQIYFEKRQYKECISLLYKNINKTKLELNLLASSYDKISNYTKAVQYYSKYADLMAKYKSSQINKNDVLIYNKVNFEKCTKLINKYSLDKNYNKAQVIDNAELCFMIGFPRSGTTLLESVLDSQNNIYSLSELGIINPILSQYNNLTGNEYPLGLDTLKLSILLTLREEYAAVITNVISSSQVYNDLSINVNKEPVLIVDKLPLNAIHIPFIRMMFPKAKIVFSVRNPLDVILSCFQQDFDLNQEMSYLITLDDCVNRYIEVLDHVYKYEKEMSLDIHYVKYENLISNFESEVTELFSYLNVNYNENYKRFFECASEKLISTPSRGQVIQPIYKSSFNKWVNYSDVLLPYIEKLTPYFDRFGYNRVVTK